MEPILLITIASLLMIAIFLIVIFRSRKEKDLPLLQSKVEELRLNLSKIESNLKEDFRINREENARIAKDNREELNNTLKDLKLVIKYFEEYYRSKSECIKGY